MFDLGLYLGLCLGSWVLGLWLGSSCGSGSVSGSWSGSWVCVLGLVCVEVSSLGLCLGSVSASEPVSVSGS